MRVSRVLAVTATACAAMAFSAPLASAGGDSDNNGPANVQVDPYRVHQGGTIRVTADGCRHGGTVTSNAFRSTRLSGNSSGHASATARVYDRATPGKYNLVVKCDGSDRFATKEFTVVSGRGALGGLGGSVGPSSTEMTVGAGLVASAAIGGSIFVLRRRRTLGEF
ncbi:hypothetical protein [Streptomyces montanisoli]|uniref:Integral membrane protein n=1 Tax=Streptomyces montanisoli TaxID=2798581 RepID=A0A940RY19_9ACTN|nr:hypothetical protein [Streptomyces montanisoli]MBP0460911.1 hypothetical protein [Streptomyces montanisoli]